MSFIAEWRTGVLINRDHIVKLVPMENARRHEAIGAAGERLGIVATTGEWLEAENALVPNTTNMVVLLFCLGDDGEVTWERWPIIAWSVEGFGYRRAVTHDAHVTQNADDFTYCIDTGTGIWDFPDDAYVNSLDAAKDWAKRKITERRAMAAKK